MAVVYILLTIIIILLGVLIFLFFKKERVDKDELEKAILSVWQESGLDEQVGRIATYAENISKDYKSLEQMLRVPHQRGALGEIALEQILSDQLPPDMFGIRAKVLKGKIPDAYIKSTVGLICIDSKFPLDNYRQMIEAEGRGDMKEAEEHKKKFLADVERHLDKIANDYVCPEDGSAEFAFAYIPSESVYYFLITNAYDLLNGYISKGVHVVSPLTISHKIALIRAGIHAKRLSEQAEKVQRDIFQLKKGFEEVGRLWKILYETHILNAGKKARELDEAWAQLKRAFDQIAQLSDKSENLPTQPALCADRPPFGRPAAQTLIDG